MHTFGNVKYGRSKAFVATLTVALYLIAAPASANLANFTAMDEQPAVIRSLDFGNLSQAASWLSADLDEDLLMTFDESSAKDLVGDFTYLIDGPKLNVVSIKKSDAINFVERHPSARLETDRLISPAATQSNVDWGLDRIDQSDSRLNGSYNYTSTGRGVTIYVVDSGVMSSHSELSGRVLPGAYAPAVASSPEDCDGHGTHVAAIAAGNTYGVAKSAKIYPLRILDCKGQGRLSLLITAMDWIFNEHPGGPAVINMSIGSNYSPSVNAAIDTAARRGFIPVASAGNDSIDACYNSPASASGSITVGATTRSDSMAYFSNYGDCVDVLAPGNEIRSASIASRSASTVMSGTSMSAPFVSGAIARLLEINPTLRLEQVREWLAQNSTVDRISRVPFGTPNRLLYLSSDGFLFASNPSVAGELRVGSILSVDLGTWDVGTTHTYQWNRNGQLISGEQSDRYVIQPADYGQSVSVTVTGTRGNASASRVSPSYGPIELGVYSEPPPLYINGQAAVGQTLSAVLGSFPIGTLATFQWISGGFPIPGEEGIEYVVQGSDLGKELSVSAQISVPGYELFTSVSPPSGEVSPGLISPQPEISISGSVAKDQQVTAVLGSWPLGVELSHIWTLDGMQFGERNQMTVSLDSSMVGKSLDLVVTATLEGYADAVLTLPSPLVVAESVEPGYWTKRLADSNGKLTGTAKFYAKNVIGVGKVSFRFNGKEIAWVRALDESDPKLRLIPGANYLVRSVSLQGGKNVFEIFVNGERVKRTAYSR